MDDPNLVQNLTSISPDQQDNMTSVSPSKRTIVLGVVNTTGMKSSNLNRKRRWDQPPEDVNDTPVVKKLCLSDNETLSLHETESPETAVAVSSNIDRLNSQGEYTPAVPNQNTVTNSIESEEISEELQQIHNEHISSEGSTMSIDLPEVKSDRLTPPICEASSDITLCSEHNENLSEVNVLETCDRLHCNENVNSHISDSTFVADKVNTSCNAVCEIKTITHDQKSGASATVVSHQSEELRRIMFSYDESSSDSDTMDSSTRNKETSSVFNSNKIEESEKEIENASSTSQSDSEIKVSIIDGSTTDLPDAVAAEATNVPKESENAIYPHFDNVKTQSSIQPEFNSKETDAFNEINTLGGVEERLIESHHNIPNTSEFVDKSNNKSKYDLESNEIINKHEENEIKNLFHSKNIYDDKSINAIPINKNHLPDLKHSVTRIEISGEEASTLKNDLENRLSDECNQNVESMRGDLSVNNGKGHAVLAGERIDTVISVEPNETHHDLVCIDENQSSMSLESGSFDEKQTEQNIDDQGKNLINEAVFETVNRAVLHETAIDQEKAQNTVKQLKDNLCSTYNSEILIESLHKISKIDIPVDENIDDSTQFNKESAISNMKTGTESLMEVDDVLQGKETSHGSATLCFEDNVEEDKTTKSVKNISDINVVSLCDKAVSLSHQDIVEETEKANTTGKGISSVSSISTLESSVDKTGKVTHFHSNVEKTHIKTFSDLDILESNVNITGDNFKDNTSVSSLGKETVSSTIVNKEDGTIIDGTNHETNAGDYEPIIDISNIESKSEESKDLENLNLERNMIVDCRDDITIVKSIDVSNAEIKRSTKLVICADIGSGLDIDDEGKSDILVQNASTEIGVVKNSEVDFAIKCADIDANNTCSSINKTIGDGESNDSDHSLIQSTEVEPRKDSDKCTSVNQKEIVVVKEIENQEMAVVSIKTDIDPKEVSKDTELQSLENNEIEISEEETIETEISIVENVENELCSLETEEIDTVEEIENKLILSTVENAGNDTTIENFDEGDTVEKSKIFVDSIDDDENIDHNLNTEVVGNKIANVFAGSNENDLIFPVITPSEKPLEARNKTDVSKNTSERDTAKGFQEKIADENASIEECEYDDSNIAVTEDIEISSANCAAYEGELSPSLEEPKDLMNSFDVSGTVDEAIVHDSSVLKNEILIDDNYKTITQAVDVIDKVELPVEIASEISFVEGNILPDESKALTEDIESYIVEEVVTCESSESDKDLDNELCATNDDTSSPVVLEEICDAADPLFKDNQLNAAIKKNTVDSEISTNENQNEAFIESNLDLKKPKKLNIEKSVPGHIVVNKDFKNEPMLNSIRPSILPIKMECESTVNSITKIVSNFTEEEMEVDEPPSLERPDLGLKRDYIKKEKSSIPLLNTDSSLSQSVKEITSNIPLLKTVTNSVLLRKEKNPTPVDEINRSGNIPGIDPKLEPITLRIYKDNLSVKTDDLDSPKKHKSPKLSSELKSQLSPHIKSTENRSSLSPTTKKLEFTLKIAKDANTNIPRATMSPKNNVSPSGIHKSGDILRAELESGRSSPAYISPDSSTNKVKLKISKSSPTGLSKEYVSHLQGSSSIKEEMTKIKDEIKEQSTGISLPKTPIEIGSVFKKMMETERSVPKSESNVLNQSIISSNPITPMSVPLVKKRGRPRKIIQKVLTTEESNNSSIIASPYANHSPGSLSALDVSSGVDSSDQMSSRQVRSCRARTKPIVIKTRKPRGGGTGRGGMRGGGRGGSYGSSTSSVNVGAGSGFGGSASARTALLDDDTLAAKLSEREKAELAKIQERREKQRLDRIAKNEAKEAKKRARKLKDEERRLKRLREKAEKAEAAAPQVFEEETRMSAPDGGSRGHTPAPASAMSRLNQTSEHNEESQNSISTPTSSQIKRGRMEIPIDLECKEVRVDQLAEYHWQGSELNMVQEQVSLYLGVKSFKRKYPDLKRRPVEAEERTFLEDSGLVPKSMCDLGLTAVSSAEVLDVMYHDFPDKYEEFRKYVREKQAKEASFKQKTVYANLKQDKSKGEPREQALEAVAMWNSNLNRERREERRCALDLQTFTVHYPKQIRERMSRSTPKSGVYPVSLIPGQFSDYYKLYTPTELMYFPLNTVMYGPLKPNERQPVNPSDGSGSESSSSSTSDDSSGSSSSDSESEDQDGVTRECKICNGEKKTNKESHPEILLQCSNCKGLCHPTCQEITPEMLPHIKKYNWHCSNCKKCMQCKNTTKDDKMLFCDLCDRGYHIHCVGLRKAPEGRWHCSVCSFCTVCSSKDPGGPEWNYEYKKTDKGVRLYQRTLCVPCSKNALM